MILLIYIIIIALFLIDNYLLIVSPFLDKKRKKLIEEKKTSSRKKEAYMAGKLEIEYYPKKCLIGIYEIDELEIDIPYVRLKEQVKIKKLTIKGVKKIYDFNVEAEELEIIDSKYSALDGAIFEDKMLIGFYKAPSRDSLIEYAKTYNISRKALKYFSNAKYIQLCANEDEIRISKPYYDDAKSCYLICPHKAQKLIIRKISINYEHIDFLYIPDSVKRIKLERESSFNDILSDSSFFKLRNGGIVRKESSKYVSFNGKSFVKSGYVLEDTIYKSKYKIKRYSFKESNLNNLDFDTIPRFQAN